MKVLIATPYFYPKIGGLENYAYKISLELIARGWDVHVVTSGDKHDTQSISGITVHHLRRLGVLSNTPFNPFWKHQIKKLIRSIQPDVINVHAPVPTMALAAAAAAGSIPVVTTYHAGSMKKGRPAVDALISIYEAWLLPKLLRRSARIITASDFVRQNFLQKWSRKTITVTPAVDTDFFIPALVNADPRNILFIGDFRDPRKGLHVLLEAMRELPKARLRVIGAGQPIDLPNVEFIGQKQGKDLVDELQKANVLILPSTTEAESFGMVLIEAMACGTAVIGSDIGGIPGVIHNNVDGLLVPPNDAAALKRAIKALIRKPRLAISMGEAGRSKVTSDFTWEKRGIATAAALSDAANSRQSLPTPDKIIDTRIRPHVALLTLWGLTQLGAIFHQNNAAAGIAALIGTLFLPGAALLYLLKPRLNSFSEKALFAAGLSIILIMLTGLLANQLLPLFGDTRPLSSATQAPWLGLITLTAILAAMARNRHEIQTVKLPRISLAGLVAGAAVATLPALSALGSASLNAGGSNRFTLIAYGLIALAAITLVVKRKIVPNWLWPWTIFNMALSLLFATSLRGYYVTGHDVQLEYYVFQLTDAAARWSMSNFQDAYNACLSITILPVVLKAMSGIADLSIYKVVYQVLFALGTVGVFILSRRYMSAARAFAASFIFMTFPTFFTDMPMLNRQEIAFMFFILLLLTLTNKKLSIAVRRTLFALLGAGIVLSHYSTTFVAIALLAGGYIVYLPIQAWRRRHEIKQGSEQTSRQKVISAGVVLVIIMSTILWTGLYTRTGNNISATVTKATASVSNMLGLSADPAKAAAVTTDPNATPQQLVDSYSRMQQATVAAKAAEQGGLYASASSLPAIAAPEVKTPLTNTGEFLSRLGLNPETLYGLGRLGYTALLQGMLIVGTIISLFMYKRLRLDYDLIILAPIAITLLVVQTVVAVIDYGVLRMLQQDLIILVIPVILGIMQNLKWVRIKSEQLRLNLTIGAFAVLFLIISGFIPQVLGGSAGQLPLRNSGFYYDAYYTDSQDVGTYKWLSENYPKGYPINSDKFSRMKILVNAKITTVDGLVPSQITRKSYVVLGGTNISENKVSAYYGSEPIAFITPLKFYDSTKDLIYSTNSTRVYH